MTQKLKIERLMKELRQQDVADYLGLSVQSYSAKETGKTDFTLTEVKKLLELFDKKFEDIFQEVKHEN